MKTNFADSQSGVAKAAHAGRCLRGSSARGFTLVELLTALGIMAILLALAVPSFRKVVSDNRALAGANSLAAGITFAKAQAIKLGRPVTLCPSADGLACDVSKTFDQGWLVIVDQSSDLATAPNLDTTVAGGGVLMGGSAMQNSTVVKSGQNWVRILPRGIVTEAATMTVKPTGTCRPFYSWQQIAVGIAGRVSITKQSC